MPTPAKGDKAVAADNLELDRLGSEGWELVAVTNYGVPFGVLGFFKRRISN